MPQSKKRSVTLQNFLLWAFWATLVIVFVSPAYAQVSSLSCGADSNRHDWDTNPWPAGSLAENYSTNGETLNVSIAGDTGNFVPDSTSAPVTASFDTGGLSPAELSLELFIDFINLSDSITITFDVGQAGVGVEELQFLIFDVDFGEAQFQDEVIVMGYLNGVAVSPTLTPSSSNTVSGNIATGQVQTSETSSNANLGVTFNAPIDQFEVTYKNGSLANDPPGQQAISIHDIFTCPRLLPEIVAQKTVETYDPSGSGLYNVPGTEVTYTLSLTNIGTAPTDTDSLFLTDSLPEEVVFFNGDLNGPASGTSPVIFSQTNTSSLSFDAASDLRFSNSTSRPSRFTECSYFPSNGHDTQIKHVCFNPKGSLNNGSPAPTMSFQFRTKIQ